MKLLTKKSLAFFALIIGLFFVENSYAGISDILTNPVKNIEVPELFKFSNNFSDFLEVRRGGSFGGRRGGSFSRPRSTSTRSSSTTRSSGTTSRSSSFGGARQMSSQQAKAKYGVPRRTETKTMTGANGLPVNYNVHHYGGFSSGLMTGYLTGNMLWYMTVPAFFYSRPVYVTNPDGTKDVYPPTFNWGKLFFVLLIIAAIVFLYRRMKNSAQRTDNNYSGSSFG